MGKPCRKSGASYFKKFGESLIDVKKFMKRIIFIFIFTFSTFSSVFPQQSSYEAEILSNPNPGRKDTREVNAVLIFEEDSIKILSRRRNVIFKTFKYAGIKSVEHSFSKNPIASLDDTKTLILLALGGYPLLFERREKHWLTIVDRNDFAVLKIENDNYRLIKMEFAVRDFKIENVNEDKQ